MTRESKQVKERGGGGRRGGMGWGVGRGEAAQQKRREGRCLEDHGCTHSITIPIYTHDINEIREVRSLASHTCQWGASCSVAPATCPQMVEINLLLAVVKCKVTLGRNSSLCLALCSWKWLLMWFSHSWLCNPKILSLLILRMWLFLIQKDNSIHTGLAHMDVHWWPSPWSLYRPSSYSLYRTSPWFL